MVLQTKPIADRYLVVGLGREPVCIDFAAVGVVASTAASLVVDIADVPALVMGIFQRTVSGTVVLAVRMSSISTSRGRSASQHWQSGMLPTCC